MKLDSRDIAWEWAMAKGWAFEITASTITVRDGSAYVIAGWISAPRRRHFESYLPEWSSKRVPSMSRWPTAG
jgi:hypothetical protein